jgi:hypothetical protein
LFYPLQQRVRALRRFGAPVQLVPAAPGAEAGGYGVAIAVWRAAGLIEQSLQRGGA